ncbi:L-serine ammonia-lyase [Oceanidesulfovibrio indonesiensis]|uniref:L-serine dehydratase n=1 Tax=Oceanidesulfovibrio indonesiensis TaxID=54767 RepID=A0A7M3MKM1_9BACT|nr:L-serine ammonia-lyase [Oceanidesulfovibrio indonesiensis]TVM19942.1 L-serine ammonia-lyase [Oceanidesulfovibrio indonesiensis]
MSPITTSLFELFTIGPGPSSSHTIGPMRAGNDFRREIESLRAEDLGGTPVRIQVVLYGSLAATGEGHGTPWAALAGLAGMRPEDCPPDILETCARDDPENSVTFADGTSIAFAHRDVTADMLRVKGLGHPNTLLFRVLDSDGTALREAEYHSVGGGSIRRSGRPVDKAPPVPHVYYTMRQLRRLLVDAGLPLDRVIVENECALTGASEAEVLAGLDAVLAAMEDAVRRGLAAEGELPGPLGLHRKARAMHKRFRKTPVSAGRLMLALDAYALAAAEENAAGHTVVTAPTCGSAGVLPSVAHVMKHHLKLAHDDIRRGLCAAALVGLLARHNASVAGAEVGCQGEIGVAASMAAAMLAMGRGLGMHVVENAAETALEHHLGMTCDPVAGYVQIPCIERNAMGAVKAFNAYVIASSEVEMHHMVGLDQAIIAMAETGRDMHRKYKETSLGGLAASMVNC